MSTTSHHRDVDDRHRHQSRVFRCPPSDR
jgi:hypothetical protein